MRTYIGVFSYWATDLAKEPKFTEAQSSPGQDEQPAFLTAAALAKDASAALKKFRGLLLRLYQSKEHPLGEILPSGATVRLDGLFDLTELGDSAASLNWVTVATVGKTRGLVSVPAARNLRLPNPTEKHDARGKTRIEPFVIFPDLR